MADRPAREGSLAGSRQRRVMRVAERELARGPASTAETRGWLKAVSASFGFDDATVESLTLVASELLANAFLHAAGPFAVSLEVERDILRVGVSDRSTLSPVLKAFDDFASTGRGLRIVQATSLEWGTDMRVDGKTVWADLALPHLEDLSIAGDQPGNPSARGEVHWAEPLHRGGGSSRTSSNQPIDGDERTTSARTGQEPDAGAGTVQRVIYRDVPVEQFIAMRARIEAMLREGTLIVLGGDREDVPEGLRELARRATTQFLAVARAEASAPPEPVARREGTGLGDFAVDFPAVAAEHLEEFADVVKTLNEWCRSNHLLVAPLTDEMQRLHRWSVRQAAAQIGSGVAPQPFVECEGRSPTAD